MDAILTEFLMESMTTEAEALEVVERAEQLRPNPAVAVVHLVYDTPAGVRTRMASERDQITQLTY